MRGIFSFTKVILESRRMDRVRLVAILIVIVTFVSVASAADEKLHPLKISRKGKVVTQLKVEPADTPEKRMKGLMFRKTLPEGQGMWFIFDSDTLHPFWMENTYISLDIIFVDNKNKIVSISRNTQPLSRKPIFPQKPYRYVLEVPAGFAAKYGLKKGDRVGLK